MGAITGTGEDFLVAKEEEQLDHDLERVLAIVCEATGIGMEGGNCFVVELSDRGEKPRRVERM